MAAHDPVPWAVYEDALGAPATEVERVVERVVVDHAADPELDADPYDIVKSVHDTLDADFDPDERSVPGLGDPFVAAYLLEKHGVVAVGADSAFVSLVDRRPSDDRLHELFWNREYTLWWIGVLTGVHAALVTYWCYEANVPLMERNLSAESLAAVESVRESR